MEEEIYVGTKINREAHAKLKRLATTRKTDLGVIVKAVLEWAGDQSASQLARQGVNIPLWPNEIGDDPPDITPPGED